MGADVMESLWNLATVVDGVGGVMGALNSDPFQVVLLVGVPPPSLKLLSQLSEGEGVEYTMVDLEASSFAIENENRRERDEDGQKNNKSGWFFRNERETSLGASGNKYDGKSSQGLTAENKNNNNNKIGLKKAR